MSKAQIVDLKTLPPVTWEDMRVMTTELLAKVYGTRPKNLHDNFQNNKTRFVEGKHFYKLEGAALKAFKADRPENFVSVKNNRLTKGKAVDGDKVALSDSVISSRARSITLWTERGAMRHAKMLETDAAWEVYETLEECYFAVKKKVQEESTLSTPMDRYPLYGFTIDTVLRHRILFSKVYLFLNLFAGSKRFKEMTKDQASEVIEFADRFAIGQDTRKDWRRIQENQAKLHGEPIQVDFVNKLLAL